MVDFAKKHLLIVMGPSQSGKDTLIYNFDRSNKENSYEGVPLLQFGDGMCSETKESRIIKYKNEDVLPGQQGYILNTVGLGDTQGDFEDEDIALDILEWCLREGSKINGGVNGILFVQALTSPFLVEKCIKYVSQALGSEILKSSLIVATKGNLIKDEDEFEMKMDRLQDISIKYGVPIFDFRGKYFVRKKGSKEMIDKVAANSDAEVFSNVAELGLKIQNLPKFSFEPLLKDLVAKHSEIIKRNSQSKKENKVEKIGKRRRWYTLWLVEESFKYTTIEYENIFLKTDQEIVELAMIASIAERTKDFKEKIKSPTKKK